MTARRLSLESFLATVGGPLGALEPWVTGRIAALLEEDEVAPGESIFAERDLPSHFFFLRQGRVELTVDGAAPTLVEGPSSLGMLDVLAERPRVATARALTPLALLRIRADSWVELLEDSFELARTCIESLARSVAAIEMRKWERGEEAAGYPRAGVAGSGAELDMVERVAVLMRVAQLRGSGAQPIGDLAGMCEEVTYRAGELVNTRGPRDRAIVLFAGRVEATRGDHPVTWRGGPGNVVTSSAPFAGEGGAWHARALVPSRALTFAIDDWLDVLEENFEMVRSTLATLAVMHGRSSP